MSTSTHFEAAVASLQDFFDPVFPAEASNKYRAGMYVVQVRSDMLTASGRMAQPWISLVYHYGTDRWFVNSRTKQGFRFKVDGCPEHYRHPETGEWCPLEPVELVNEAMNVLVIYGIAELAARRMIGEKYRRPRNPYQRKPRVKIF